MRGTKVVNFIKTLIVQQAVSDGDNRYEILHGVLIITTVSGNRAISSPLKSR